MAKLIIKDETDAERVHELTDDVTTIGRSSNNTIQITDKKSSRNHFRVERNGERFRVVDLGSTNGTRLNEEKVATDLLCPGDVLRIGMTTFRFDGPGEARKIDTTKPPPVPDEEIDLEGTVDLDQDSAGKARAFAEEHAKGQETDKPKYVLEVIEGPDQGKRYELGLDPLTIGRKPSNTIKITDEASSSFHAEVKKEPIGYVISDLGSTNGTRAKARGASDFEKIVKTPLSVGMQIKIGKTIFEYKNVGKAQAEDELFGTVVLDPEKLEQQIAERPSKPGAMPKQGVLGAVAVAVFLAIVAGVVFFLPGGDPPPVDPTPPPVTPPGPPVAEIRLENADFSKDVDDQGNPIGWKPLPGQPGVVRITVDAEAQAPVEPKPEIAKGLVIHKSGATSPSTRSFAETLDTCPVDPAKSYEVSGWLKNDGDGLVGLRLQWEKGDRKLPEPAVVLVGNQPWKERSAIRRPPPWADRVRLSVFTEGREGKASFDNLNFKLAEGAGAPATPSVRFGQIAVNFEGGAGIFSASVSGVTSLTEAQLALASTDDKIVSGLESAIQPQITDESGKATFRGRLYDFQLQSPTNYLVQANPGAGGVEVRFAIDPQPGSTGKPRLTFYLEGAQALGEVELGVGGKQERLQAADARSEKGVTDVTFNIGQRPQLYLNFSSPVNLSTKREGLRRYVEVRFDRELAVELAPENVSEKQILATKLQDLDEAMRKEQWSQAFRRCQEIDAKFRSKFDEARQKVDAARSLLDSAWKKDEDEMGRQLGLLKQFGAGAADAVEKVLTDLASKWADTPKVSDIKNAMAQIEAARASGKNQANEEAAARELDRAQKAMEQGGDALQVAVVLCNKILRDYKDTAAAKGAQELLAKAKAANEKYGLLLDITDRLKKQAEPFVKAGDYESAIKLIRNDKDFREHQHELTELKTYLQALEAKRGK